MSKRERKFTPFSEIDGKRVESGKKHPTVVIFDSQTLPEIDNVGINLPALRRRCHRAGIHLLRVSLGPGETSTAEEKIQTYSATIDTQTRSYTGPDAIGSRWAHVSLRLNSTEMERRIKERTQEPSAKDWAKEINRAIQEGIVAKGIEHMIGRVGSHEWFMFGWMSLMGLLNGLGDRNFDSLPYIVSYNSVWNISLKALSLTKRYRDQYPLGYRWSFFIGPQIDRALLLYAQKEKEQILGQQKLVRAL